MRFTVAQRLELLAGASLWLLLLAGWALLHPGLHGAFAFDDAANLAGLSGITADPGWYSITQYIANGISSTIGRPLSLLTFALQHHSWPGHPADFIRVGILLHLLNACLMFWTLLLLRRLAGGPATQGFPWLPLAVTLLWTLAPLHTNAVLYVVQRMAVLAGTFVLLGLVLHLQGRIDDRAGRPRAGIALMSAGVVVGLGLGTLAKENAALYPLLVLVVEATLLHAVPRPRHWRAWSLPFLGLPLLLLTAYLAHRGLGLAGEYAYRPFTLGERLCTEARVLFLYLKQLFAPSLYSVRILYDDLAVSRTLLDPWTTLPALGGWIALLAGAVRLRHRAPVFSFAVLWFFTCHLLESTFLPLELAFLHRNYLAVFGPLLLAATLFGGLLGHEAARRVRPGLIAGACAYALLVASALYHSASLWGDPKEQSRYWAMRQPDSRRAALLYSGYLLQYGLAERGGQVLHAAAQRWPADAAIRGVLLNAGCFYPDIAVPGLDEMRAVLMRNDAHLSAVMGTLASVVEAVEAGRCERYALDDLEALLDAATRAPSLLPARVNLRVLQSRVLEIRGDRAAARAALDAAVRESPRPDLIEQAVYWSLQARDPDAAHDYLALARRTPALKRWAYRRELAALQQLVERHKASGPIP